MRRSGGASYVGFLEDIRSDAAEPLTKEEVEVLAGLVDASPSGQSLADLPQPAGPGRTWNRQELNLMLNDTLGEPRDFSRGETMYAGRFVWDVSQDGDSRGKYRPGFDWNRIKVLEARNTGGY